MQPRFHCNFHKRTLRGSIRRTWIRSTFSDPIYTIPVLVMSPCLRLFLPCRLFPLGFFTKTQDAFLFSPKRATSSNRFILLNDHTNNIWWNLQIMKRITTQIPSVAVTFLLSGNCFFQIIIFSNTPTLSSSTERHFYKPKYTNMNGYYLWMCVYKHVIVCVYVCVYMYVCMCVCM